MKNTSFVKSLYIVIHDSVIDLLITSKECTSQIRDKYCYIQKAINLIFHFQETIAFNNQDYSKHLSSTYMEIFLELNKCLVKEDDVKIDNLINKVILLKKFWQEVL